MILAIDTTTHWISLALADKAVILAERTWRTEYNHTSELAPAVDNMLSTANASAADLHTIAVALGPGSFSGLRVGLGFAKGLALANRLRLVGVPTHDIITFPQPSFDGTLLAIVQMGRGRIAASKYQLRDDEWITDNLAVITTWDDLLTGTDTQSAEVYVCGEIDEEGRQILGDSIRIGTSAINVRRAACLAEIAQTRYSAMQSDEPSTLVPIYLQQPVTSSDDKDSGVKKK